MHCTGFIGDALKPLRSGTEEQVTEYTCLFKALWVPVRGYNFAYSVILLLQVAEFCVSHLLQVREGNTVALSIAPKLIKRQQETKLGLE